MPPISPPLWRPPLERSLHDHRDRAESRHVQMATVRRDGLPANRTLVFRSFLDPGDGVVFTADSRSVKVDQLAANPWAELCWYFPASRQQFRLLGTVTIVADADDGPTAEFRSVIWRGLSDEGRRSFAGPTPGESRAEDASFELPAPASAPANFVLLVLAVESGESLDLRTHPPTRTAFLIVGGEWTAQPVNP